MLILFYAYFYLLTKSMLFYTCYDISPPKCDYLSYNDCQSPLIIIIVIIITIIIIIIIIIPFANCHYHVIPLMFCYYPQKLCQPTSDRPLDLFFLSRKTSPGQLLPLIGDPGWPGGRGGRGLWRSLAVSERWSWWMTWMKCGMNLGWIRDELWMN